MVNHQPHPPGYILYIFLGRILNFFLRNDTLALTSLSNLCGSISAVAVYLLIKKIANKKIALFSTILFLVTPIHWTLSEVALTNLPGMFLTILTAYFLFLGKDLKKQLFIGSFLAGLTLGVRFAEWSIVISLLILVLLYKRKSLQDFIKTVVFFTIGISLWLIPLIIITGWSDFISAYQKQANYLLSHDSLLVTNSSLITRLSEIWKLFLTGYSPFFVAIIFFVICYLLKTKKLIKRFEKIFILVWLFSYLLPLVLIYNLEVPRHLLPLLPPLVLLFSLALRRLENNKIVIFCSSITMVAIFFISLIQVQNLHTLIPPSIAPVLYVKENYDPKETRLITTFTYRQFQYYAPEFKNYYGPDKVLGDSEAAIIIIDFLKLKEQIPFLTKYNVVDEQEFSGPEEIFPRLPKTNLFILKKE